MRIVSTEDPGVQFKCLLQAPVQAFPYCQYIHPAVVAYIVTYPCLVEKIFSNQFKAHFADKCHTFNENQLCRCTGLADGVDSGLILYMKISIERVYKAWKRTRSKTSLASCVCGSFMMSANALSTTTRIALCGYSD